MEEQDIVFRFDEDNTLFPLINNNPLLWRYLTFTKFESLIKNKALFFTRLDFYEDYYKEGE